MLPQKIAVGDRITFKAATRCSNAKATRQVIGLDLNGRPLVIYQGWHGFVVRWDEVLEIHPQG